MNTIDTMKLALEALTETYAMTNHAEILKRKAITALREALALQPAQQQPVAFYVYKPTLPRGHLGTVSDGDLPWVYDQDPSSGFSARMLVAPVTSPPAQRKPLTNEQFQDICNRLSRQGGWDGDGWDLALKEAIEAAHGIKENT